MERREDSRPPPMGGALWRAAGCFFASHDKAQARQAAQRVLEKAGAMLDGLSGNVAAGIRTKAKGYALAGKKTIGKVSGYRFNCCDAYVSGLTGSTAAVVGFSAFVSGGRATDPLAPQSCKSRDPSRARPLTRHNTLRTRASIPRGSSR